MLDFKLKTITDADFFYIPNYIKEPEVSDLFERLKLQVDWKTEYMSFYGKITKLPRLNAYYGEKDYVYSGILNKKREYPEVISAVIKHSSELVSLSTFNSVLLNYYRNEKDTISWHSDDETSLGANPEVASLSFGQERVFYIRNKTTKLVTKLTLESGSLLIMGNNSQVNYEHKLPRVNSKLGERINLTFRKVI